MKKGTEKKKKKKKKNPCILVMIFKQNQRMGEPTTDFFCPKRWCLRVIFFFFPRERREREWEGREREREGRERESDLLGCENLWGALGEGTLTV